jgi:AraC-like DNA-binding protein
MTLEYIDKKTVPLYRIHKHSHPQWELIYNYSGYGTMDIGDKTHSFKPGTVALLPPGTIHDKTSASGYKDYYLQFSGCCIYPKIYVFEDDCDRKLLYLIRVLYSLFYENREKAVCDSLLESLIGVLQPYMQQTQEDWNVRMLQNKIIQEFSDPFFSVKQAFCDIPVNKDHLRRRFKAALGMPPVEYLTSLRIQQAKHLLSQEGMDISEVAYQCGFCDPLYFSRVFRKNTEVAPSAWKKQGNTNYRL